MWRHRRCASTFVHRGASYVSGSDDFAARATHMMKGATRKAMVLGEKLPPGVRSVVGAALMVGGVFGFLPILGFWMLPAGLAVASLDVPPLRRRLEHWAGMDEPPQD